MPFLAFLITVQVYFKSLSLLGDLIAAAKTKRNAIWINQNEQVAKTNTKSNCGEQNVQWLFSRNFVFVTILV